VGKDTYKHRQRAGEREKPSGSYSGEEVLKIMVWKAGKRMDTSFTVFPTKEHGKFGITGRF
jgi:hypothetical protein